jgi:aryl-phospho-beta-D-glucosidase BglC (GH1 family)
MNIARLNLTHLLLLSLFVINFTAKAQITPQEAAKQIKRGINIGNTMEPPTEGGWNNSAVKEYYFDDYKSAGFTCIRIPVRWEKHTMENAPYTVDQAWLARVEQVVDWGLQRGLYIIINAHHEDWLKQNYSIKNYRDRFDSIWAQVAFRFKDKSDKLLFEILNEPFGMSVQQVNDLNQRIIPIIRKTNPTRIIIYSGNDYTPSGALMAAAIPKDNYIMGYFHSYDPWNFAGLGQGTWGTASDVNSIKAMFQTVAQWSAKNNIPVMISEFGAVKSCDYNSRMYHYSTYVSEALNNGIAFQAWDDGGDFGLYNRSGRSWDEIKDILTKTYPQGPTALTASVVNDTNVTLKWTNRTSSGSGIRIERKTDAGQFTGIAALSPDAVSFNDTGLEPGKTYYYRVVTISNSPADMYSYPVKVTIIPKNRSSYKGIPFDAPGTIEAEDYDIGGEGLTYHDTDPANVPGAYRPSEGVDIEARPGGYQLAYVAAGEWLEYTLNVKQAGVYTITAYTASMDGGGKFRFEFGGTATQALTVPKTGSWTTLVPVSIKANLSKGLQIMRLSLVAVPSFNIDRFVITSDTDASVNEEQAQVPMFSVYPNPAGNHLNVRFNSTFNDGTVELYNILGELVKRDKLNGGTTTLQLNNLSKGVYFLKAVINQSKPLTQKIIIQ